ncbi:MAG: cell division protein ZapB [Vicinamibacterales bacterium]
MATKTTSPGLEPIDRLEEKIKMLVGVITRLKGEQTRAVDENARLQREVESLTARLADFDGATAEVAALRDERDQIRARVTDMLEQLDTLSL